VAQHPALPPVLINTDLPRPLLVRGKVRDVYDLGDRMLLVATDRISAFDVVLPCGIPDKGKVLTQLSEFWFHLTKSVCPNHLIGGVEALPNDLAPFRHQLAGRSMVTRKAEVFPVECVVRGYLSGSAWEEYQAAPVADGTVRLWDESFPAGLRDSDRLPQPAFTPTTKAATGHDEHITFAQMVDMVGEKTAHTLKELSIAIYSKAAEYALSRGFIIADTKFEFGLIDGQIALVDEALTPDSSRFWDAATYVPGRPQPAYDKQVVRDYLLGLVKQGLWNKEAPGPQLPDDVIAQTRDRYLEAFRRLTGRELA